MIDTLNYYNKNATEYFDNTVNADLSEQYNKFLQYLPKGSYILDLGCGSGRDSKYFLKRGYRVKAIDGSYELCKMASNFIGQEVENISFNEINYNNVFDGIWACASLLHVDKNEISNVISRLEKSLKVNGVFYASFKYGNSDRLKDNRYFNDLNEHGVLCLFKEFDIKEIWLNDDVRKDRNEKWINCVAIKK